MEGREVESMELPEALENISLRDIVNYLNERKLNSTFEKRKYGIFGVYWLCQ